MTSADYLTILAFIIGLAEGLFLGWCLWRQV